MAEHFDETLLEHIRYGRNDEAKTMLNEELAKAYDASDAHGTLLHHAAAQNNAVIARKLIALGANVDRLAGCRTTPLTIAVLKENVAVVHVLLEANARIDIIDNWGYSALKLALDWFPPHSEMFGSLACQLKKIAVTNEELAETLIRAGCNMCHAATLKNIDLMECMLKRRVDVNSKGLTEKTALHIAAEQADVSLADWLLNKGADIDAFDDDESSALMKSAEKGNKVMVQFLLERGANPDGNEDIVGFTSLHEVFSRMEEGVDKFVACAEILLQYGASLEDFQNVLGIFRFALDCSCDKATKLLTAHLAMLELLDKPIDQSFVHLLDDNHVTKLSNLMREYYEPCQQVLTVNVFEKWSLLDLLNTTDHRVRLLVRKEMFLHEVDKVSSDHKLKELYSYYYNSMMRRIEKASRVVNLEDETILVICKIFDANYNQFYDFARGVVEYLTERDLESLVRV